MPLASRGRRRDSEVAGFAFKNIERSGPGRHGEHPKQHAGVWARFKIETDIPSGFRVGIFKGPRTYTVQKPCSRLRYALQRKESFAPCKRFDRLGQVLSQVTLAQKSASACTLRGTRHIFLGVNGKDQNSDVRVTLHNLPSGVQAMQTPHVDVHQNEVRLPLPSLFYRFPTVCCFRADLPIRRSTKLRTFFLTT